MAYIVIIWGLIFFICFVYYLCNRKELHPVKRKKKYPKA